MIPWITNNSAVESPCSPIHSLISSVLHDTVLIAWYLAISTVRRCSSTDSCEGVASLKSEYRTSKSGNSIVGIYVQKSPYLNTSGTTCSESDDSERNPGEAVKNRHNWTHPERHVQKAMILNAIRMKRSKNAIIEHIRNDMFRNQWFWTQSGRSAQKSP